MTDAPIVRKPVVGDVPQIIKLIGEGAKQGENLPRSQSYVFQNLRDFVVVERNAKIVGCASLHVLWQNIAEVRAAAVDSDASQGEVLQRMIDRLVADAQRLGVPQILVLAMKPDPFIHIGFRSVEKESLPQIAWRECTNCVHFPNCVETALVLDVPAVEGTSA